MLVLRYHHFNEDRLSKLIKTMVERLGEGLRNLNNKITSYPYPEIRAAKHQET